ncbi:hypothetical protein E2C01_081664 [Portunus trituberculatus]|uniref:Uncharacterized protein n=1 Tax=Portunus trituberculatus TaxID=210409 RepID=A0A5B7IX65_PORTR|nr:hypothetical protein [Portunus trituberculatus]
MVGVDLSSLLSCACGHLPAAALERVDGDLVSSQRKLYLSMLLDSVRALVFPLPERISQFLSVAQNFLEDKAPTMSLWSLLGHLASPGEAGPRRPGTLSIPSVVPEKSLEGSVGPSLVADLSWWMDPGDGTSGTVSVF